MKMNISSSIESDTRAVLWTHFWYQYNITYACTHVDVASYTNTTCNFEDGFHFWEFQKATQYTRILFGSSWCVVVLSCFIAIGSVITGQKKPLWVMLILAIVSVVGFASFFTTCIRADSSSYGCDNATFGPCDSFVGRRSDSGPTGS